MPYFKSFVMHNREITHIVKTDSLSKKKQLIVRTKTLMLFLLPFERNLCQN